MALETTPESVLSVHRLGGIKDADRIRVVGDPLPFLDRVNANFSVTGGEVRPLDIPATNLLRSPETRDVILQLPGILLITSIAAGNRALMLTVGKSEQLAPPVERVRDCLTMIFPATVQIVDPLSLIPTTEQTHPAGLRRAFRDPAQEAAAKEAAMSQGFY